MRLFLTACVCLALGLAAPDLPQVLHAWLASSSATAAGLLKGTALMHQSSGGETVAGWLSSALFALLSAASLAWQHLEAAIAGSALFAARGDLQPRLLLVAAAVLAFARCASDIPALVQQLRRSLRRQRRPSPIDGILKSALSPAQHSRFEACVRDGDVAGAAQCLPDTIGEAIANVPGVKYSTGRAVKGSAQHQTDVAKLVVAGCMCLLARMSQRQSRTLASLLSGPAVHGSFSSAWDRIYSNRFFTAMRDNELLPLIKRVLGRQHALRFKNVQVGAALLASKLLQV